MDIRKKIIEASEYLIKEKGIDNLRVDKISEKANISKRTLYKYFESKEKIIRDVILEKQKKVYNGIQKIFDSEDDEIKKYEAILNLVSRETSMLDKELFLSLKKYPDIYDVVVEGQRKSMVKMKKLIKIGIQKKEIDNSFDPEIVGYLLIKMASIIFEPEFYIENNVSIERVFENFKNMIINGLLKR